ncbi:MAG: DUF4091 domain-containing protein [Bacteroidales bacterium]|nr:DUF4091 domain-containing protein [Bacteroidales bacterium]
MRPFYLSIVCLFASAFMASAQTAVVEMADPHPTPVEVWNGVKTLGFGWGSIDSRYKKDDVPSLSKAVALYGWRGERVNAQAVLVAPEAVGSFEVSASDLKSGKNVIPSSAVDRYFATYVMGEVVFQGDSVLAADRLVKAGKMAVEARTVRPVWLTVNIPRDAVPGKYKGTLTARADGKSMTIPYTIEVSKRTLPEPKDWKFHLDLWQNPYAVARYFDVPLWSEEHFAAMRPIMEYLASAGEKVITASIFQYPWNKQTEDPFESMIGKFKGMDGSWRYDYTVFDKWVEFMMSCGITEQIDCYSVLPWHLTFEYFDAAKNFSVAERMEPGSKEYEEYLLPFLTDFARHLKSKGWFEKTCIAMDERPKELLEHAYAIVHKADKDFKIEGAINYFGPEVAERMYDISFAMRPGLPIQMTHEQVADHLGRGKRVTFYTCCSPQRPNTFTDSAPAESAYLGWYAAATGYSGYLRWAYNSWVKDPCLDSRFRSWRAGDCYLVYPDGPSISSQRLIEGIQDNEKIRAIRGGLDAKKAALLDAQLQKILDVDWENSTDIEVARLMNESKALLKSLE